MDAPSDRDRQAEPCEDRIALLVRAADDSLDASDRAQLDRHLAACPACSRALETQRGGRALLARAFDAEAPLGFSTRVLAHLESSDRWIDRLDFRRWTWRVGPVTAALLLAAWMVTGDTTSAAEAVVNATDAGVAADAVLWSDVMNDADLVSITWEATVAGSDDADVDGSVR